MKDDIEQLFEKGKLSNTKRKTELKNLEARKKESEMIVANSAPSPFQEKSEKQKKAWLDQAYRKLLKKIKNKESEINKEIKLNGKYVFFRYHYL